MGGALSVHGTMVGSDRLKADNLQRSGDTEFGAKSSRQMPQKRERTLVARLLSGHHYGEWAQDSKSYLVSLSV